MQSLLDTCYVILSLSVFLIFMLSCQSLSIIAHKALAASPPFAIQEIRDDSLDWVNMTTKQHTQNGDLSTDILSVNYFSDGKSLNATLWLYFPFEDRPIQYNEVNYGMLIDADFNPNTGYDGIDYQLQVGWKNQTKTWDKTLFEWGRNGQTRTLDVKHNYSGFFEKQGKFVELSLNLNSIVDPSKYKVTFYVEGIKGDKSVIDFTRWVAIPPLKLFISTSPPSLNLRKGETKTIEVRINSTEGYDPLVFLNAEDLTGNIKPNFQHDFNKVPVPIPSYGIATIPLTVSTSNNAVVGPHTIVISANSTFPPDELFGVQHSGSPSLIPPSEKRSANIATHSTMAVMVQEPLSLIDIFSDLWTKLGPAFTFVFGITIDRIAPWLYGKIRAKNNK
jgi:hypothetical protein